jgi:hypothetical protein
MSDDRLYREMDAVLKAYDENKVGFRALLDRLEECVDNITGDAEWRDTFRRVWDKMEQPYAYAAAMGWRQIPQDRVPAVLAALSEVRKLVSTKLAEASTDDPEQ